MASQAAIFSIDVEHTQFDAVRATERFLRLLDRHGIRATFFMTGEVVAKAPELARSIREAGHELASHGRNHPLPGEKRLAELDHADAKAEIEASYAVFEERGFTVSGFRAPTFSITPALLKEVGRHFAYDASIAPAVARRFGFPNRFGRIDGLTEIPVSAMRPAGIAFGSSALMMHGPHAARWLAPRLVAGNPIVFYAHSFDLGETDFSRAGFAAWKQAVYYRYCSPQQAHFFDGIINGLQDRGVQFKTCSQHIADTPASTLRAS